jgi:hypothetical protein
MIFPGTIENWGKAICLLMIYLGFAYIACDLIERYAIQRTGGH